MNRPTLLAVVVAGVVAVVAASSAVAKLPPDTAFEACGESGCRTVTVEQALDDSILLLEPTHEHGDVGAPAGAAPWIRVDIGIPADPGELWRPLELRSIERRFPAIFVPEADSVGVPRSDGAYRWVSLRSPVTRAYARLAEGVEPFPAQDLSGLDQVVVAGAGGAPGQAGDDGREAVPTVLIVGLAALGVLLVGGLAYRGRRLRHVEA
jgi:hypothetical protein